MVVSHVRERVFSAFNDLQFEEGRHIYTLDGVILPSVSRLVESHVQKIDFDEILPYSAIKQTKERGYFISSDELRAEWKKKNKDACDLGHDTHSFMELFDGSQKHRTPQERAGVRFFLEMSKEYDVLFREIRMFSRQFMFAGTEDLILIHRETGHLIAADYKTNGDLFKNYKGKRLLPPFEYLEEHPYNKYKLQLSYYEIMLEEVGLCVDDRWLVYLRPDGEYKIFSLESYVNELKEILKQKKIA